MEAVLDAIGIAALAGGLLLATIGLIGLLRMEDIFTQLHTSGLVTGPGLVLVLAGAIGTAEWDLLTSAALVAAFVAVTAPLSAHVIADAAHRRKDEPPADEEVL